MVVSEKGKDHSLEEKKNLLLPIHQGGAGGAGVQGEKRRKKK